MTKQTQDLTPVFVYVDTNIAMHFLRPDQIDWTTYTGSHEVVLVATPIFLRELDRQKFENNSRKLRERARNYVNWLSLFIDDPKKLIRSGVRWKFISSEPDLDFSAVGLSSNVADDQLIASVLSSTWASASKSTVATDDIGLTVKLKGRKIAVLSLPENLRLPDEPDELEAENANLRRRLRQLEARMPILTATFQGGAGHRRIQLPDIPDTIGAPSLEQVREKHTTIAIPQNSDAEGLPNRPANNDVQSIARRAKYDLVRSYNDELEHYFNAYTIYLNELSAWQETICLQGQFKLVITNSGTARASRIDLDLYFPEGILPITEAEIPRKPKPPREPVRPGRTRVRDQLFRMTDSIATSDYRVDSLIRRNYDGEPRTNKERRSAHVEYSSLKHGYEVTSEPVIFWFLSRDQVRSFCINYTLSADELPEPVEGELHIRIEGAWRLDDYPVCRP